MNEEKKEIDLGMIGTYMIVVSFCSLILMGILVGMFGIGSIFLFIVAFTSIVIGFFLIILQGVADKGAHMENINTFREEYDIYADKIGVVRNDKQVTLIGTSKYGFEVNILNYLWTSDNCIKLFPMAEYYIKNRTSSISKPDVLELKLKSIPVDSILYFEEIGELRKYTTISGGGTSLKGALLGYAIAEDTGAIIGSREPITTKIVSEDDRRIELIYKNPDGAIENLEFKHDAYNVFKKIIPLKEFRRIANLAISENKKMISDTKSHPSQTAKEKLMQLNDLKTEGLITEEEYTIQKQKILDSI